MTTLEKSTVTHKPGMKAWLRMVQAEARMVMRDTAGLLMPVGLPLVLLVMLSMTSSEINDEIAPGVTVLDYHLLPVVITTVVTIVAVMNMPNFLATYRKTKILRRLAVTPASPAMVLIAQMIVSFIQVLVGIGIAVGVALLFFDANMPHELFMAVLVLLATCAALYGVGMIVASISPTVNAAMAFGLIAFMGMAALGGMFAPVENFPDWLQSVSNWLPFASAVEAFQSVLLGESIDPQNWLVLGGTTVLGTGVAAAFFRWE